VSERASELAHAELTFFHSIRIRLLRSAQKCDLTYVQHADAKGYLPAKVMDRKIHRGLRTVIQLREKFNRDDEIDQEERNELMGVMKNNKNEVYSEEENEMVGRITKKMENVKEDLFTPLNSSDIRTKVSVQFVPFFQFASMKLTNFCSPRSDEHCAH